jgi:hypothetical protein
MSTFRAFRGLSISYQPRAECRDAECGWKHRISRAARDQAKIHVRITGHSVTVTVEKVDTYDAIEAR